MAPLETWILNNGSVIVWSESDEEESYQSGPSIFYLEEFDLWLWSDE